MIIKKLYIIRHAKAEEHSFAKQDYYRDLIDKGIDRANRQAEKIKSTLTINAHILFLSSSANRALQTAHIFAESLDFPIEKIIQTKNIYEAHYKDILKEINKVTNEIDTLLIFGHNPGLSDLTNYLCNTYITLKTSAIAEITLEEGLHFTELSGKTAYLNQVISE